MLPDSHLCILLSCLVVRLSQILGHALRKLQSPGELSDLERSLAVQSLNQELDRWLAETPRFFHPDGPDACDLGPFASIPPFFQRYVPLHFKPKSVKVPTDQYRLLSRNCSQQQIVRSAYHFINLFIHRSFLLDQFINRIPASQPLAPLTVMSPEVTVCVESAISIAKSVSKMRDSPGAKGTFWVRIVLGYCTLLCSWLLTAYGNLEFCILLLRKPHCAFGLSNGIRRRPQTGRNREYD